MLEMLLQRARSGGYNAASSNLVMAMDFDTGWTDLANASRTFSVPGSNVSLATAQKINGSQSYLQSQTNAGAAGVLQTSRTTDLTFAGDFWVEMWGYCLGQGNYTFTSGSNYLFTYGKYTSTGLNGLWLNNLTLSFSVPSGGSGSVIASSKTQAVNGAWQHFAVGRKNGVLYLFLNGKLVGTAPYTDVFGFDNVLAIGGYYDARIGGQTYAGFNGYIDRLRVYNACAATSDFTPLMTPY